MTTIHARQIHLTKMRINKQRKYCIKFLILFPTILHTRFYPSPSILTTLPPIYICIYMCVYIYIYIYIYIYSLPITPGFLPYPTLHFKTLPFTSLRFFTLLHDFHFTSHLFTILFNDFPNTVFSLTHLNNRFPYPIFEFFSLQGRVPNTSAGS